jgi:hypothetical protein
MKGTGIPAAAHHQQDTAALKTSVQEALDALISQQELLAAQISSIVSPVQGSSSVLYTAQGSSVPSITPDAMMDMMQQRMEHSMENIILPRLQEMIGISARQPEVAVSIADEWPTYEWPSSVEP